MTVRSDFRFEDFWKEPETNERIGQLDKKHHMPVVYDAAPVCLWHHEHGHPVWANAVRDSQLQRSTGLPLARSTPAMLASSADRDRGSRQPFR